MTPGEDYSGAERDFSELRCPQLLVEIKLLLRQLKPGEHLNVVVNDTTIVADLARLSAKIGFGFEYRKVDSQQTILKLIGQ